ncbi:hypothetical protein GCM10023146_36460 [Nocardioides caricicola]
MVARALPDTVRIYRDPLTPMTGCHAAPGRWVVCLTTRYAAASGTRPDGMAHASASAAMSAVVELRLSAAQGSAAGEAPRSRSPRCQVTRSAPNVRAVLAMRNAAQSDEGALEVE